MQPGRELDALIAEKVMGWTQKRGSVRMNAFAMSSREEDQSHWVKADGKPAYNRYLQFELPDFSNSIADAWDVVEKLQRDGFRFIFQGGERTRWASFYNRSAGQREEDAEFVTEAGSDAQAICLAALKAVGVSP